MHGVVSLLDAHHDRLVREIWATLEDRFGLRHAIGSPFPHVSYHVAAHYDFVRLSHVLSEMAHTCSPIVIQTTGLGLFTGPEPVLYLPVVRNPTLDAHHRKVWRAVEALCLKSVPYYAPEHWVPHITLADGEGLASCLPEVVGFLSSRQLQWQVVVDNLSVIHADGAQQEIGFQCTMGAPGEETR